MCDRFRLRCLPQRARMLLGPGMHDCTERLLPQKPKSRSSGSLCPAPCAISVRPCRADHEPRGLHPAPEHLLPAQVPPARCPLDEQDGVPGVHSPGVAEAGSAWAALCHTVISPASSSISSGGLAPLQSSCQVFLCLVRPQLCPPSLPLKAAACSCARPGGGSLTALVPHKAGGVLLGTVLCSAPAQES